MLPHVWNSGRKRNYQLAVSSHESTTPRDRKSEMLRRPTALQFKMKMYNQILILEITLMFSTNKTKVTIV